MNNRRLRWASIVALLATAGIPAATWIVTALDSSPLAAADDRGAPASTSDLPITALGRVQPRDGVITIAAPSSDGGPAIVATLRVRRGEWVSQGQVLATLRGQAELEASLISAKRAVQIARARLTALTSGGKADDLDALRSEVQSEDTARAHAEADAARSRELHAHGLLDSATLQAHELRVAVAARALDAKRARFKSLSSVRPADVAVAHAELRAAEAAADEIRASIENATVRAPFDGRVLDVRAFPGQAVAGDGLLTMGKTDEMFVDAEVLEEDLRRARVGQRARITGTMLSGPVEGTVEEIGLVVGAREVFGNDPTAFSDGRIVHVKIRAANPAALEHSINARVTAVIQP
jgi:HlyD family secretion protein